MSSFFKALKGGVSGFLSGGPGGALLGAGLSVLGAKKGADINVDAQQKSMQNNWRFMERKGLTPQEIAGSGAAGGVSSSAGNTLGNQAGAFAQQALQHRQEVRERDKDRAVALRGQNLGLQQTQLAANASVQSSGIAAGASRYSSDNSRAVAEMNNALSRDRFQNIDLPDALRRSVTESPAWKRLQILAGMGVDNMIGTAIGNKYGLDPMDPDALSSMSASDFRKMVTEIYGIQSRIFGESAGSATVISNGLNEAGASLGRLVGR